MVIHTFKGIRFILIQFFRMSFLCLIIHDY
nr:MAG TPA: hypothetical protein [Inoviridae sp.]